MTREIIETNLSRARREDVAAWMQSAQLRDDVIYHVGAHCAGPHRETVRKWSDEGYVVLFQKRAVASGHFKYIARRTAKPCPK